MAFSGLSLLEAKRTTLAELRLYQRAQAKRQLHSEKELYLLAFLNRVVKATSKDGKHYVYKDFKDFYDEEERQKEVLGEKKKLNNRLARLARRNLAYKQGKGLLDG